MAHTLNYTSGKYDFLNSCLSLRERVLKATFTAPPPFCSYKPVYIKRPRRVATTPVPYFYLIIGPSRSTWRVSTSGGSAPLPPAGLKTISKQNKGLSSKPPAINISLRNKRTTNYRTIPILPSAIQSYVIAFCCKSLVIIALQAI